ncbi:MAG: response regulator [Kofleriaceae bacterium]
MTFSILHTGQTGVERGAYRAARLSGIPVSGVCNRHARDEILPLPADMLATMRVAAKSGSRFAAYETVALANAVLIAVPDVKTARKVAGIGALLRAVQAAGLASALVDPAANMTELSAELQEHELRMGKLDLFVTGPRQTRWAEGEQFGFQLVSRIALVRAPRRRILVVDDDRSTLDSFSLLLRALGHDCVTAPDGRAALEHTANAEPEIAIIDIRLPDMTGYELATKMRARHRENLFMAAITGWDEARDPAPALAAGFDRHLLKPAAPEIIQAVIAEAETMLRSARG